MTSTLSDQAFGCFRAQYPELKPTPTNLVADPDQVVQISEAQGLAVWKDGSRTTEPSITPLVCEITDRIIKKQPHLWAVRADDVVTAPEKCPAAETFQSKVFKHSNLTGGGSAHSAGELLFLDDDTIVVNGCSGRYGPRSAAEMTAVALAFRRSGYVTWSMGFDTEAGRPFPFIGKAPEWVSL